MIKFLLLIILVFLFFLIKFIIIWNRFQLEFSDYLDIFAIFINIGVPIYIAHFLQNKFLKNNTLKNYHIKQLDDFFTEYNLFIDNLLRGNYNRREIANKFKIFTIRLDSIDKQNFERFNIDINLQEVNRQLHMYITSCDSFNNSVTNSKVKFSDVNIVQINMLFSYYIEKNGRVIYTLHK